MAVATIATAGSVAAGVAALSAATYGATAAGASVVTTTLAFATVGAGVTFTASAIVAGIDAIEETITSGSIINGINSFFDAGESAMWSTIGSSLVSATIGYLSYVDYGTKTVGKSHPFGIFYNTKDQTVTHYGVNGKMWWSKHLNDHGRPDLHPVVPHWHAEMPHSSTFNTPKELIFELIRRFFGG